MSRAFSLVFGEGSPKRLIAAEISRAVSGSGLRKKTGSSSAAAGPARAAAASARAAANRRRRRSVGPADKFPPALVHLVQGGAVHGGERVRRRPLALLQEDHQLPELVPVEGRQVVHEGPGLHE